MERYGKTNCYKKERERIMYIYEVTRSKGLHFGRHIVIAKNEENAKKLVADMLNVFQTAIFYRPTDFEVSDPIDPNNYREETVIY